MDLSFNTWCITQPKGHSDVLIQSTCSSSKRCFLIVRLFHWYLTEPMGDIKATEIVGSLQDVV